MIFINHSVPIHRKTAIGGMITALILLSLFLSAWLPTNKFLFLGLASLLTAVVILETDILNALLVYGASAILGFFILPHRGVYLAYLFFFGLYGLVKLVIEQIRPRVIQWTLKILFFNLSLWLLYQTARLFLEQNITIKLPWEILLLAAQAAFVAFDILYTLFVSYYHHKWRRRLKAR